MSIRALDAASAYASSLSRSTGISTGSGAVQMDESAVAGASGAAGGSSFAAILENGFTNAVDASRAAEGAAAGAVKGTTDLIDVVTAVNNAEVALETVVAMRDRMISAYQEIMRMPI
jgi:flagellar hook-basal body complex protein FliE